MTTETPIDFPPLPEPVGKVTRQHETPGHFVEDGGRIVSVPFFIVDDVSTLENLFTSSQMREYVIADRQARQESDADDAKQVCGEAYQVVGSLLSDLGQFNTDRARKVLDNLSAARLVHGDVLPWPSFEHTGLARQEPDNSELTIKFAPPAFKDGPKITGYTATFQDGWLTNSDEARQESAVEPDVSGIPHHYFCNHCGKEFEGLFKDHKCFMRQEPTTKEKE